MNERISIIIPSVNWLAIPVANSTTPGLNESQYQSCRMREREFHIRPNFPAFGDSGRNDIASVYDRLVRAVRKPPLQRFWASIANYRLGNNRLTHPCDRAFPFSIFRATNDGLPKIDILRAVKKCSDSFFREKSHLFF